jgi:hypothetical protein
MPIQVSEILDALSRYGLLLKQDKILPNVVTLVTGESLASSWWSHARAHEIFTTLSKLSEHPDVLFVKLIRKKDTLVHRSLWPALLRLVGAHEPALLPLISAPARALLRRARSASAPIACSGAVLKELTARVLVYAFEVHTASGRHEMLVEPWFAWQRRVGVSPLESAEEARRFLHGACERVGASVKDLPWHAIRAAAP